MGVGPNVGICQKYAVVEDKIAFQNAFNVTKEVGWLRDIPEPRSPSDDSPEALERSNIEKQERISDEGEVRMFQLFAEGIEGLYTGMIEEFARNTPALWEEFAMRTSTGDFYLVDPRSIFSRTYCTHF